MSASSQPQILTRNKSLTPSVHSNNKPQNNNKTKNASVLSNNINKVPVTLKNKFSKPPPSKDQIKKTIFKAIQKNTPQKSIPVNAKPNSSVKKNWKIPAHSGVPMAASKSPFVGRVATKQKSAVKKKKKVPAHSGVPVSFSKRQLSLLLLDNN